MWLITLMVIQILFICSCTMIGYHGKIDMQNLVNENSDSKHAFNIKLCFMFRGMKPRDLLLRRYWRREDDGSYGTFKQKIYVL